MNRQGQYRAAQFLTDGEIARPPQPRIRRLRVQRARVVHRRRHAARRQVGAQAIADSFSIRRTALTQRVPHFTTISAALAAAHAIEAARAGEKTLVARSLQDYHRIPGDLPDAAPASRAGYRSDPS